MEREPSSFEDPALGLVEELAQLRSRLARAEARLAEAEMYRRQSDLLRLSFDAVILWRMGGGIESWNLGAERLYGYTEEEALGRHTHDFLQTRFPKPLPEIEEDLGRNGMWEGELRHTARNGRALVVSARMQVVRHPDGAMRVLEINRDITEKKRAESRLRRFYETDLFAILYWRLDGGVLDANDKFLLMTGYTREDLRAGWVNWAIMTPPEFRAADEDALRQIREVGYHRPFEKEYIRKDGSRVWGLISSAAWEDNREEGVSFILDITARKRAEVEVAVARVEAERTAAQLRTVLDSMAERVYVCDAEGRLIVANQAARGTYAGNQAPDVSQMPADLEVRTPDGRLMPREAWPIARILRGESVHGVEIIVKFRATDIERILSCNGAPVCDREGRVLMAVQTSIDITDRKRAEHDLRRANERLELAADVAKLGEWEVNLADGTATRSRNHSRIFGYPDESAPWSMEIFVHHLLPAYHDKVHEIIRESYAGGAFEFEAEIRRADGEHRWIWVRGRTWPETGKPTRIFGTVMDITESKRTAQALLQSEKLATVGRLASTIAHEINNPLEAVGNALYLAVTDPGCTPAAKAYLEIAAQELERVSHIARQTLAFHRDSQQPTRLDVSASVEDMLRFFASRIQARGIAVEKRYAAAPAVFFSRAELAQILANLVANALDATPRGGRIIASVGRVLLANGTWGVRMILADTGCGISTENLVKVFEPFFTTKELVGTGLGLWVCKQLAEKHGATIRVRSKIGCGTVFEIVFRRVEDSQAV